jgi:hypothetical protein
MPTESPAQRALAASAAAGVVAIVALGLFLPPFSERYLGTPARVVADALVLATALLLHWAFLGIAVRRLGRSLLGWMALAVLLFPVGGAAALILLGWFGGEADGSGTAAPHTG